MGISKKTAIVIGLVVVVLVAIAIWVGINLRTDEGNSEYSAVYLSTGDIYFGKLSWFMKPRLTNVWYLQRTTDQKNQPQVGIMPFKSAFWGPSDEITLNPKDIIFVTRLRKDSQVVKALDNPQLIQQQAQEEVPQRQASTSTTTEK